MEKKSDLTDPVKFHSGINIVFHNVESLLYDKIHKEMHDSLLPQYNLLVNDAAKYFPETINMVDVGCGTGLSSELLLKTKIKNKISGVTLLDTSAGMLEKAKLKSIRWQIPIKLIEGEIKDVADKFDLILISSVLHHIPDLKTFLVAVTERLKPGGILLTIHDPLQEAIESKIYLDRCSKYHEKLNSKWIKLYNRVINSLKRRFIKEADYIEDTNQILLTNNIIHTKLSAVEVWSVTDIHVENLPSNSNGISIEWMKANMPTAQLISYRTYAFFGTLESNLNGMFKKIERLLYANGEKTGRNFGSIWVKK